MAFISQLGTIPKRSGRVPGSKFVSFRKTKSGATGGLITKDTGLRGTKIAGLIGRLMRGPFFHGEMCCRSR